MNSIGLPVQREQLKDAIIGGILFLILGHPRTYLYVSKVIPNVVVDGRVTFFGLCVHAAIFTAITYGIMIMKQRGNLAMINSL